MVLILTIAGIGLVLLIAEYLARFTKMHAELTRKFVHMLVGTFVAFWPFFLRWRIIELFSVAFLVVILISVKFTIFKAIHTVPRQATGEIGFAVVIGLLALISTNKWVFLAAMLNLSIGDALAAVIGLLWGRGNRYKVFGKTKSIVGTSAFFVTSVLIMILYVVANPGTAGIMTLFVIPITATLTENIAVNGTDNLVMPILIALLLGHVV